MPEVKEAEVNVSAADVTVTTTTEKVAISSGPVRVPTHTARFAIVAWCQLTTGTGTTGVTIAIRRGTGITGTLVNEANVETIKTTAGSTEVMFSMAEDEQVNLESAEYSLTVKQAGASGNGTILQAGIQVLVL